MFQSCRFLYFRTEKQAQLKLQLQLHQPKQNSANGGPTKIEVKPTQVSEEMNHPVQNSCTNLVLLHVKWSYSVALTLWILYGDIGIPANFRNQSRVVEVGTAVVAPVVALVVLVPVPVVVLPDVGVPGWKFNRL